MMKVATCVATAVLAVCAAVCDEAVQPSAQNVVKGNAGAKNGLFYKNTGGFVHKPGSSAGKVVFVNAQERFPGMEISAVATAMGEELRVDVAVSKGEVSRLADAISAVGKAGGTAGVVIAMLGCDDPVLMVFPDERCAVVNVAAIPEDVGAGLFRRQIARGLAAASGAMSSQVPLTLMSAFENQRKLEAFPTEKVPADVIVRVKNALRLAGVTPYRTTTYRRACQEGWAPAPTNDVQKAIWDEVHEMPTEPIKIKYQKPTNP